MHLFLDLLGRAAAPIALFCVGATLPPVTLAVIREALSATFIKLVVMPVAICGLCFWSGFEGENLAVPVVAAALPTGANAFLLARGSTTHGAASATTVVIATGLSLVTLPLLLYWLKSIR